MSSLSALPSQLASCHVARVSLKQLSTFGTGGIGHSVFYPRDVSQLVELMAFWRQAGEAPVIVGNGSNAVLPDGDVHKPLIVTKRMDRIDIDGITMTALCGASLPRMARQAGQAGLAGLEFAIDIPGTCGAGVIGNAGAYHRAMADVVTWVDYLDTAGELVSLSGQEIDWFYRDTSVSREWTVVRAQLALDQDNTEAVQQRMTQNQQYRREAQPHIKGSAGSIFKNPDQGPAWRYVESAGLKGYRHGGAMVSPKHGNWIINAGDATSQDIQDLVSHVQQAVLEHSGVSLKPEIRFL